MCVCSVMVWLFVTPWTVALTVKKAEHRRIDAFELWCWRRLLRVPWTARRSNQSILKISPGISLEGMMLKLKLQYCGHLMWKVDSLKKTLMLGLGAGGEGGDRGWDGWMSSLIRWTWVWVNSGSWWWTGRPGVLRFMGSQRVGHDWATELNWIIEYGPAINAFQSTSFLLHKTALLIHLPCCMFSKQNSLKTRGVTVWKCLTKTECRA